MTIDYHILSVLFLFFFKKNKLKLKLKLDHELVSEPDRTSHCSATSGAVLMNCSHSQAAKPVVVDLVVAGQ